MVRQAAATQVWLAIGTDVDGPDVDRLLTTREANASRASFDTFRALNTEVADSLVAGRAEYREGTRRLLVAAFSLLAALTVLSTATGAVTALRTVRALNLPLRRLGDVLERLRMGETSARADPSGPLEFALVARAANALADESERLRETQREQARLRRAAHDASRRVREELDRDAVLHAAATALGRALDVDRVWIRFVLPTQGNAVDGRTSEAVDVQWARPGTAELPGLAEVSSTGFRLTRHLWREGDVLQVPNVARRTRSDDGMDGGALAAATGATSLVVAPVGGNDDVLAAVTLVVTSGPREFTPEEVGAVQSVCADLGRALEHSLLFEQQLELVDRLQELDRQKTDFLSTVSHELRTPLTSISGYAELLRDGDAGPVTAPMARMLEVIERNTVRLKALIEDLLTLSRIESAAFRTSVDDVALAGLVAGVEQAVLPQATAGGIDLRIGYVAPGLQVRGDEMQLERVLLNLVVAGEGTTVTVRLPLAERRPPARPTGTGAPGFAEQGVGEQAGTGSRFDVVGQSLAD